MHSESDSPLNKTLSLDLRVLGSIEATRAGLDLPLGGRRQRALLAMLVLDVGKVIPSEQLIDDLWESRPPPGAAKTLRSYISRLRRLLSPEATLIAHGGGYVLELGSSRLDARRFEQLTWEGQGALARGDLQEAARLFREGLALWRGRAFADVLDIATLALESRRLEELRLVALEGRIEAELELGLHAELVGELERLVAEHPLRERLWRQLVLALYRCDRQADALATYRRVRELLARELGLEPGEELRRLEQAVLRHDVPSVRPSPRRDLPVQLTSLIGRKHELAELETLLGNARLVTVTGVGGVGKTRLALAAAERVAAGSKSVCFVDLSRITDSALVPHEVVQALGLRESSDRYVVDVLSAYLRTTETLLLLDNCEHVSHRCSRLVEALLRNASALHILATSREPFAVSGEIEYALPPLSVPPDGIESDELAGFSSAQLFLERAAASGSHFQATPSALAAIARICRELDGIPLAIELAAARAKALSPEEIAAHLDRRFDFLKFWREVAVPRHQTLRATMDWSYDLLSEQDRRVLRRLSVFAGGFTLTAAASVSTGGDEAEAVDAVGRLVDRSLLVIEPGEERTRYRLLETVRQYAAERLVEEGEHEEARRAHAVTSLRLAEEAFSPGVDGLSVVAREQANMRAALEWAFAIGDELGPRLARALGRFWHARGQLGEGRSWLERALALHRDEDGLRAELLGLLGDLLHDGGELARAFETVEDGLRIAVAVDDPSLEAILRVRDADVRYTIGAMPLRDALSECAQAARVLEAAGRLGELADALVSLGRMRFWLGDEARDQQTLERAIALARESGNRRAELRAVEWLAISFVRLRVPTDVAIERQELLLAEAAGELRTEASIRAPLAWLYGYAGRFDDARDALARSRPMLSGDFGWMLEWAAGGMNAGAIELMAGDPVAAERELRPAYDALGAMGAVGYQGTVAYYLACSLYEQGLYDEAASLSDKWAAALLPLGDVEGEILWILFKARLCARRGQLDAAERLARETRSRFRELTSIPMLGEALVVEGEVLELAGDSAGASAAFKEAQSLYESRHAAGLSRRMRARLEHLTAETGAGRPG